MRENKLKAQVGYKRRYIKGGKPGKIADNILDRQFSPEVPNQAWVSDITYIRTHEGFYTWRLYWICFPVELLVGLWTRRWIGT